MQKPQRAPAGLGHAGSHLWRSITREVVFRPDELAILEQAARTADTIREYEQAAETEPLTVRGSTGQPVIHPLRAEIRALRAALASFLGRLDIPEDGPDEEDIAGTRTLTRREAAKKAAKARWANNG